MIFNRNDILTQKYKIMNYFEKNSKLFKIFQVKQKEIKNFYNEH